MRLRANSTWAMLEFVFNGMVFLLLGLQLPDILSRAKLTHRPQPAKTHQHQRGIDQDDVGKQHPGLDVGAMRKLSQRFLKKKPMEFGSWTTRELLISSVAGVRGGKSAHSAPERHSRPAATAE
jgi:hypothetical protein